MQMPKFMDYFREQKTRCNQLLIQWLAMQFAAMIACVFIDMTGNPRGLRRNGLTPVLPDRRGGLDSIIHALSAPPNDAQRHIFKCEFLTAMEPFIEQIKERSKANQVPVPNTIWLKIEWSQSNSPDKDYPECSMIAAFELKDLESEIESGMTWGGNQEDLEEETKLELELVITVIEDIFRSEAEQEQDRESDLEMTDDEGSEYEDTPSVDDNAIPGSVPMERYSGYAVPPSQGN